MKMVPLIGLGKNCRVGLWREKTKIINIYNHNI